MEWVLLETPIVLLAWQDECSNNALSFDPYELSSLPVKVAEKSDCWAQEKGLAEPEAVAAEKLGLSKATRVHWPLPKVFLRRM